LQLLLFDNFSALDNANFGDFRPLLSGLWADPGIREAFERRAEYQLTDSIAYFYDQIDRISVVDYVPTQQDILYCRKTTKGIAEFRLVISNVPFLFVDVGGQRTQRQKWFQCFDKVTAILFLASSSEFDQKLLEDKRVNRLEESRNIFDTIVNNRIFADVSSILFLNKMDLLEDKVVRKKVNIADYFEDFDNVADVRKYVDKFSGDPTNLSDVKSFILYLFVMKQKFIHSQKPIYHHFTTAVNTKNIQYVFASVKETILRKNLSALMLQ
jgi:guanine nucleotide-binding protein subunit alpha-12